MMTHTSKDLTGAVCDEFPFMQQQGQQAVPQRPAGSGGAQACPLCPLRQAAAQHQRRCIQVRSLAAEEASAVADEPTSGSVSEQERAQYERWAAEVAVSPAPVVARVWIRACGTER